MQHRQLVGGVTAMRACCCSMVHSAVAPPLAEYVDAGQPGAASALVRKPNPFARVKKQPLASTAAAAGAHVEHEVAQLLGREPDTGCGGPAAAEATAPTGPTLRRLLQPHPPWHNRTTRAGFRQPVFDGVVSGDPGAAVSAARHRTQAGDQQLEQQQQREFSGQLVFDSKVDSKLGLWPSAPSTRGFLVVPAAILPDASNTAQGVVCGGGDGPQQQRFRFQSARVPATWQPPSTAAAGTACAGALLPAVVVSPLQRRLPAGYPVTAPGPGAAVSSGGCSEQQRRVADHVSLGQQDPQQAVLGHESSLEHLSQQQQQQEYIDLESDGMVPATPPSSDVEADYPCTGGHISAPPCQQQ